MRPPASVAACLLLVGSVGAWAQAAKFAVTGESAGELRIVDEHIPKMKPFRLRKKQA
jgi:hypothetical protein